jgi:hypothetical protein
LAIVGGHPEVFDVLVSMFEADVLLSVQLVNRQNSILPAAIFTLVLSLEHPLLEASETTEKLLVLGTSFDALDMDGFLP